jgi:hypothetical protein
MKSLSLIKLVRAVDATDNNPYSYEYESCCLNGRKESGVIKERVKSQLYGKTLRMTGKKNHAVRYLNTWSWVVISEAKYNELLFRWTTEA